VKRGKKRNKEQKNVTSQPLTHILHPVNRGETHASGPQLGGST